MKSLYSALISIILGMNEDERIVRILEIKQALEVIEETVNRNDEKLAILLESKLEDNQYDVKNTTWSNCKAGLCPVDWILR